MDIYKFWQDRPVLVTGATGLLGSWVVKMLLKREADIVAVVRDWVPSSELVRSNALEHVNVVRGDICDFNALQRTIAEYEIKTVIHLAAQTIVVVANRSPVSTFDSNIRGTWNILEACRVVGDVEQVVVASTDKAYGEQEELPYHEEMPLQGRHPYDVSKSCADLIAQSYFTTYNLPVVITRCGNFYGGGDLNWNRIVPGTIRSVLRGQRPVIRSNGQFIRDYFYVEDGASSYLKLVESLASDSALAGQAFNFSYDSPVTVLEIVDMILNLMECQVLAPQILDMARNEIPNQYLSSKKARELLNWSPEFGLETGMQRTIAWYKDYFTKHGDAFDD